MLAVDFFGFLIFLTLPTTRQSQSFRLRSISEKQELVRSFEMKRRFHYEFINRSARRMVNIYVLVDRFIDNLIVFVGRARTLQQYAHIILYNIVIDVPWLFLQRTSIVGPMCNAHVQALVDYFLAACTTDYL